MQYFTSLGFGFTSIQDPCHLYSITRAEMVISLNRQKNTIAGPSMTEVNLEAKLLDMQHNPLCTTSFVNRSFITQLRHGVSNTTS